MTTKGEPLDQATEVARGVVVLPEPGQPGAVQRPPVQARPVTRLPPFTMNHEHRGGSVMRKFFTSVPAIAAILLTLAWTFVGDRGSAFEKVSDTSISVSPSATISVGQVAVV